MIPLEVRNLMNEYAKDGSIVIEIIANNVATTYPQINGSGRYIPNETPTKAKQVSSHMLAKSEHP